MSPPSPSLTFLLVVFVVGCYGNGDLSLNVNVNNEEIDISLQGLPDPCVGHSCPTGQECRPIYHPDLLEVPIAHCVSVEMDQGKEKSDEPQQGGCIDVIVGTNVVNCKSASQWKAIGHTQCALRRGNETPLLVKTTVQTACHSFSVPSEPLFLQATFTCCPEGYMEQPPAATPQAPSPPHPSQPHHPHHPHNKPIVDYRPRPIEPTTESSTIAYKDANTMYLFPVIGGVILALAIVAATLALCQRRRRIVRARNGLKTPRVLLATSFVNPNVDAPPTYDDEWLQHHHGNDDKSLLIANEYVSPGNK